MRPDGMHPNQPSPPTEDALCVNERVALHHLAQAVLDARQSLEYGHTQASLLSLDEVAPLARRIQAKTSDAIQQRIAHLEREAEARPEEAGGVRLCYVCGWRPAPVGTRRLCSPCTSRAVHERLKADPARHAAWKKRRAEYHKKRCAEDPAFRARRLAADAAYKRRHRERAVDAFDRLYQDRYGHAPRAPEEGDA